jgi:hypothetical protein
VNIMNIVQNLFCCASWKNSNFFRWSPLDNYVQLQFHKSMIYSYGLHFYSIRLALQRKKVAFFDEARFFFGDEFRVFIRIAASLEMVGARVDCGKV